MAIYRNWEDKNTYNYTKKLDLLGWAWEFLRRNKEYQNDWLKEMKRYFSGNQIHDEIRSIRITDNRDIIKDRTFSVNNPNFSINTGNIEYSRKYSFNFLVNPKQDRPFPNPFRQSVSHLTYSLVSPNLKKAHTGYTEDCHHTVVFDLYLPINPQIEKAKQQLKWKQKYMVGAKLGKINAPKFSLNYLELYLRLIDANNCKPKPSIKKIASIIYPNESNSYPKYRASDKIKKRRKKAMELLDGGYIKIARLGLISPDGGIKKTM